MEIVAARLHIITAREAPIAVIIRRKPSKQWHIMLWNLENDEIRHGSWFTGTLYPLKCDISWDGKYMSYLAKAGQSYETWNGICELPFLRTVVEWDNIGTYRGGAVWLQRNAVFRNLFEPTELRIMGPWPSTSVVKDFPIVKGRDSDVIFYRLYRDGFRPEIDGQTIEPLDEDFKWEKPAAAQANVPWRCSKSSSVPALTMRVTDSSFRFDLEGFHDLLGPKVEWSTWASTGDLLYAIKGVCYRLTPDNIVCGHRPVKIDLNDVQKPARLDMPLAKP